MDLAILVVMTPDIAEARRFYSDVLGFRVLSETPDFLELGGGGVAFHVFRCEAAAPGTRHGAEAASVFAFHVPSIDLAMADLKAKGVEFLHGAPASNAYGRYAAFKAPGGLVHEIVERAVPT